RKPTTVRARLELKLAIVCTIRNRQAATTRPGELAQPATLLPTATQPAQNRAAPAHTTIPNDIAQRACVERCWWCYSFHERTIRVSWPHNSMTARNETRLKQIANCPNSAGPMTRSAIVSITMFSDEPPSLIRKATSAPCAIPDSANREDMLRAIFIIEPPISLIPSQMLRDPAAALLLLNK